jgi:hypothetical protein
MGRPEEDRPVLRLRCDYLIDNKVGIIVDVEGTRANPEEIAVIQTMVDRVERRFGLRPRRLPGYTVYGVGRLLKSLVGCTITPHVPVWDNSARANGQVQSGGAELCFLMPLWLILQHDY